MMCKQGLTSLFPMEDLAVMGLWELLPHLYKFRVSLFFSFEFNVFFDIITNFSLLLEIAGEVEADD